MELFMTQTKIMNELMRNMFFIALGIMVLVVIVGAINLIILKCKCTDKVEAKIIDLRNEYKDTKNMWKTFFFAVSDGMRRSTIGSPRILPHDIPVYQFIYKEKEYEMEAYNPTHGYPRYPSYLWPNLLPKSVVVGSTSIVYIDPNNTSRWYSQEMMLINVRQFLQMLFSTVFMVIIMIHFF